MDTTIEGTLVEDVTIAGSPAVARFEFTTVSRRRDRDSGQWVPGSTLQMVCDLHGSAPVGRFPAGTAVTVVGTFEQAPSPGGQHVVHAHTLNTG